MKNKTNLPFLRIKSNISKINPKDEKSFFEMLTQVEIELDQQNQKHFIKEFIQNMKNL